MTLESFAKVNSLSWQSSFPKIHHETSRTITRISNKRRPLYELVVEPDVFPFSFDSQRPPRNVTGNTLRPKSSTRLTSVWHPAVSPASPQPHQTSLPEMGLGSHHDATTSR